MADVAKLVFPDTWTLHILQLPSRRCVLSFIQRKSTRGSSLCLAFIEKGKGKLDSYFLVSIAVSYGGWEGLGEG